MSGHDEPLTPEERDLARRLARTGTAAEPSPALDARILAAARAAAGAAPAVVRETPARRRPRFAWAAGLGVAASLLLAVGIAWQLRPQPDAGVQYSEAPAAAPAHDEEPLAELRAPDAFPSKPAEPPAPLPAQAKRLSPETAAAPVPAEGAARARRQSVPAPADAAEEADTQPAEAPVVFDGPSPVDTPTPPQTAPVPPPPPAPQAASAAQPDLSMLPPAGAKAADATSQEIANEREHKASAEGASRDAAPQRHAESLDRVEVTGARIRGEADEDAGFDDQPYDDEPPASADSPEVRTAWLARIRELLGEGKIDAARASLAEFHRRYPDAALPDDLRPLLE
jgi:hypothetical protein